MCPSVISSRNLTRSRRIAFIKERPTPSQNSSSQENANPHFRSRILVRVWSESTLHPHRPPSLNNLKIPQENCKPMTPYFPSQDLFLFSGFMIFCCFWLVISGSFSSIPINLFPPNLLLPHPARELLSVAW